MTNIYDIKFAYLYGLASPEGRGLYHKLSKYTFATKLVPEDFIEFGMDLELLEKFYRRIEALSGFKHLEFEGVWDPDTKEPVLILVLARDMPRRMRRR